MQQIFQRRTALTTGYMTFPQQATSTTWAERLIRPTAQAVFQRDGQSIQAYNRQAQHIQQDFPQHREAFFSVIFLKKH